MSVKVGEMCRLGEDWLLVQIKLSSGVSTEAVVHIAGIKGVLEGKFEYCNLYKEEKTK